MRVENKKKEKRKKGFVVVHAFMVGKKITRLLAIECDKKKKEKKERKMLWYWLCGGKKMTLLVIVERVS